MDEFLKSLGVPVIAWGASVGPFSREPEFERMMALRTSPDLIWSWCGSAGRLTICAGWEWNTTCGSHLTRRSRFRRRPVHCPTRCSDYSSDRAWA